MGEASGARRGQRSIGRDGLLVERILERTIPLDDVLGGETAANVAKDFTVDECRKVSDYAADGYNADVTSRAEWEKRQAQANKLALQVFEQKTEPWLGASSVKFPLITNAALQYQAKAYAAFVSGNELVKCRIFGEDPEGEKAARGRRVSAHMSWQNLKGQKTMLPGGRAGQAPADPGDRRDGVQEAHLRHRLAATGVAAGSAIGLRDRLQLNLDRGFAALHAPLQPVAQRRAAAGDGWSIQEAVGRVDAGAGRAK